MRNSEQTRIRINEAALRLFVEQGIAQTTTCDIADAARIAEGTIYRHYKSKDELAASLYGDGLREIAAELSTAADPSLAFREQLPAAIGIFCRLFDEQPLLFRYILLQQHNLAPRLPKGTTHPIGMLTDAITRAIEKREIGKCDAPVLAAMILGLVVEVAVSKLRGEHKRPLGRLADTISGAALRIVEYAAAK